MVAYAVGFLASSFLFRVVMFGFFPRIMDVAQAEQTFAALLSNIAALAVFAAIDGNKYHSIAFAIWLIVVAAFWVFILISTGTVGVLWFPICSIILNGLSISMEIKEIKEEGKK